MSSHSDDLAEIGAAMAAAQAEIEGATKDADNPFFKTTYATLASVWAACKPALTKNGLSVLQFSEPDESGMLSLTTMLLHKSGQYVSGTERLPLAKNDPQGYGSAITYARRYGLAAMVGVSPEDDDAEAATSRKPATAPRTSPRTAPATPPPAMPPSTLPQAAAKPYKDQTPLTCTTPARNWFFAQLKDAGLTHDAAASLLGVKSFGAEMGDRTFEQILHFVEVAKLRQQRDSA